MSQIFGDPLSSILSQRRVVATHRARLCVYTHTIYIYTHGRTTQSCTSRVLCLCLNRPHRRQKKLFPQILEIVSTPKIAQGHEPVSDLTGISSSMCFFEVAILEITIRFFKFVQEILPIQPAIQTHGRNQHHPFSRR